MFRSDEKIFRAGQKKEKWRNFSGLGDNKMKNVQDWAIKYEKWKKSVHDWAIKYEKWKKCSGLGLGQDKLPSRRHQRRRVQHRVQKWIGDCRHNHSIVTILVNIVIHKKKQSSSTTMVW